MHASDDVHDTPESAAFGGSERDSSLFTDDAVATPVPTAISPNIAVDTARAPATARRVGRRRSGDQRLVRCPWLGSVTPGLRGVLDPHTMSVELLTFITPLPGSVIVTERGAPRPA